MEGGELDLKECECETFDALAVCTGHHSVPVATIPFSSLSAHFSDFLTRFLPVKIFLKENKCIHINTKIQRLDMILKGKKWLSLVKRFLVYFFSSHFLCLGIGNSGVDIATELSRDAKQVYLITRTGAWIWPKYLKGKALDHEIGMKRLLMILIPKHHIWSKPVLHYFEGLVVNHQGCMKVILWNLLFFIHFFSVLGTSSWS